MLWFILGVIQFFCFGYGNVMLVSFKQKKTKFKPKIKLNYNIHKRKQGWLLRMLLKQGTGSSTVNKTENWKTVLIGLGFKLGFVDPIFQFPFPRAYSTFPILVTPTYYQCQT